MELNVYFVIAAKEFVVDTILFLHCPSVTRSVSVFTQKSCGSIFCNYRSSAVCQMCLLHRGRSSRTHARARSVCRLPWRLQVAPSDYSRQMLRLVQQLPDEYSC